jgi:hypothetical protein
MIGKTSRCRSDWWDFYNRAMATADEQKHDPNETDRDSVSEREREGDPMPRKRRAEDQPAPRAGLTAEEKKILAGRLERCSEFVVDKVCMSDDLADCLPTFGGRPFDHNHVVERGKTPDCLLVVADGNQFTVHTGVKDMEYRLVFVRKEELAQIEKEKPWAVWRLGECAEGDYAPK